MPPSFATTGLARKGFCIGAVYWLKSWLAKLAFGVLARPIWLVVLFLSLLGTNGFADEVALPGHALPVEAAFRQANAILAGQVASLVPAEGNGPGVMLARVKFTSPPHQLTPVNSTADGLLHGPIDVAPEGIPVILAPVAGEQMPQVGGSYIFCVSGNAQAGVRVYTAIKVIPGTPQNIVAAHVLIRRLFRR